MIQWHKTIFSQICILSWGKGVPAWVLKSWTPSIYSAQKKKVNGSGDAKYFSPVDGGTFFLAPFWQKELSHHYREKIIRNSEAVNFLFLTTVYYMCPWDNYIDLMYL